MNSNPAATGIRSNNFGYENCTRKIIDLSSATWNTVATHEVFTLSGAVEMLLFFVVKTSVTSTGAAELSVGRAGATTAFAAAQVVTGLTANRFIMPGGSVANQSIAATYRGATISNTVYTVNNGDIGYEITVAACNAGEIEAICYWTPVSTGASVVVGLGGTL